MRSYLFLAFLCIAAPMNLLAVEHTIEMRDNNFVPRRKIINLGDTVVWKNVGDNTHTATGNDSTPPGNFETGDVLSGKKSKPVTFDKQGTFAYRCRHHGAMVGEIQVRGAKGSGYGSSFPKDVSQKVKPAAKTTTPDLNVIYHSADFGRHYLGSKGTGFVIGNDFGHNHIASKLRYAGETDKLLIYDIVGLDGAQHAYEKDAAPEQFGVWYRGTPDAEFFFWFHAERDENAVNPPELK